MTATNRSPRACSVGRAGRPDPSQRFPTKIFVGWILGYVPPLHIAAKLTCSSLNSLVALATLGFPPPEVPLGVAGRDD